MNPKQIFNKQTMCKLCAENGQSMCNFIGIIKNYLGRNNFDTRLIVPPKESYKILI